MKSLRTKGNCLEGLKRAGKPFRHYPSSVIKFRDGDSDRSTRTRWYVSLALFTHFCWAFFSLPFFFLSFFISKKTDFRGNETSASFSFPFSYSFFPFSLSSFMIFLFSLLSFPYSYYYIIHSYFWFIFYLSTDSLGKTVFLMLMK